MSNHMDKVAAELPAELVSALRNGQFSKLAQEVTGVDVGAEHAVYRDIGTRLFLRRKEAALIRDGLESLRTLGGH